jgi:thiamine pyrophosphokinase
LGQLLEWSPIVVVLDNAIDRVLQLDIKVDVLLGDFDGDFDPEIYKEKQYPLEIVHGPNQEKTDLEKALDYLVEKGHKAVNIVWATGKRADHTLANITSIVSYRDKIKIVIIDDHSKIFLLPKRFEKWYTANTPISLIPVGKVTGITSQNLFYSLQNDDLILGYRLGNSNHVAQDGIVTITHETGDLLLLECID